MLSDSLQTSQNKPASKRLARCPSAQRCARLPDGPGACESSSRTAAGRAHRHPRAYPGPRPPRWQGSSNPRHDQRTSWQASPRYECPSSPDQAHQSRRTRALTANIKLNRTVAAHLRIVAHALEQTVGQARRATRARADLERARMVDRHAQDGRRARHDLASSSTV